MTESSDGAGTRRTSRSHELTDRLVAQFPQLQPVLDEHLRTEDGELLPFVFMGDVAAAT